MISLKEFCLQMNKRVAESLVLAGAFDELDNFHRGQYFDIDMAEEPIWKD
jgi:DNA polymerase III alpha subunit